MATVNTVQLFSSYEQSADGILYSSGQTVIWIPPLLKVNPRGRLRGSIYLNIQVGIG